MSNIKNSLSYDPMTGQFKWKISEHGRQRTRQVGTIRKDGYMVITINYKVYLSHRLAWFLTYGKWPKMLDHIDGNRANNRITNLREVTPSENVMNSTFRGTRSIGRKILRRGQ